MKGSETLVQELPDYIGITPVGAVAVALSAAVLYAVMAVVIRLWARRLAVSTSTVSVALLTLVAAITARSILGHSPTLLGGLVAIGTLLLLELVFGQWANALAMRRNLRWSRSPVVIMVGEQIREGVLRKYGLSEVELWSRLRQQGITNSHQIGLVILEPRGTVSVVRAGTPLDRHMLVGVDGLDDVPAEMFASDG